MMQRSMFEPRSASLQLQLPLLSQLQSQLVSLSQATEAFIWYKIAHLRRVPDMVARHSLRA